ncbi:MAG: acyl-CoA reductase [Gammaproteobacteria bacterium]
MILSVDNNQLIYLVGEPNLEAKYHPFEPYNELVCTFLSDLSFELLASENTKLYPDIAYFAFWCRKANIAKLKADFEDGKSRLGLGLVFHIAPANVPINFAFSFVFGLLSGNANVVRVPSKAFPQVDIVCSAIENLFNLEKYSEIKSMNAFIRYEQNDDITGMFSSKCNARIIWGGDATIRNIRKLSIPERSIEITFADRYSFCVLEAASISKLKDNELRQFAEQFYNDTYLMDQNACSSPHLIIWLGEGKDFAKEKFWENVHEIVKEKYKLETVSVVDKYTKLCHDAIEVSDCNFKRHGNSIYRISLNILSNDIDKFRGKCGYFYEFSTNEINNIAHIVNTKYQTLTYFGVDKQQLLDFVIKNRLLGVDRIVPVGKALDIGVIWDGYDIIKALSRIIDVR